MTTRKRAPIVILALSAALLGAGGRSIYGAVEQAQKNRELISAIKRGDPGAVERLLDEGADANAREDTGRRTLWQQVLDVFLHRQHTGTGASALEIELATHPIYDRPTWKRSEPMLRALITHSADPNVNDDRGATLLMYFCQFADMPLLKTALAHGAKVNVKTSYGVTPLMVAAGNRRIELVQILLADGAVTNVQDAWGNTPLNLALKAHRPDLVSLLRRYGAKANGNP